MVEKIRTPEHQENQALEAWIVEVAEAAIPPNIQGRARLEAQAKFLKEEFNLIIELPKEKKPISKETMGKIIKRALLALLIGASSVFGYKNKDVIGEKVGQLYEVFVGKELPPKLKKQIEYFKSKEIVKGKTMVVVHKNGTMEYVFDKEGKLVASTTPGLGSDYGEKMNTSTREGKGVRTTPSGVYLASYNMLTEDDKKEYKGNALKLVGYSILGDAVSIGIHGIYPEQYEERKEKMEDEDMSKRLSDGCINNFPDFMKNEIMSRFKEDASIIVFVTPEDDSFDEEAWDQAINKTNKAADEFKEINKKVALLTNNK